MLLREILQKPLEDQKYSLSRDEYFRELTRAMRYFNPRIIVNKRELITPHKIPKKIYFNFN